MQEESYIKRIAQRAWAMTRADVGFQNLRTTLVKLFWVGIALAIMWHFGWQDMIVDRLGDLVVGILAFVAIFVCLFVLNFFSAPPLLQKEADKQIQFLTQRLDDKHDRQKHLNTLWHLRAQGVKIRNDAVSANTNSAKEKWENRFNEWREKTLDEAYQINMNLKNWLDILDVTRPLPNDLEPHIDAEIKTSARTCSEMVRRLGEYLEGKLE